MKTKSKNKATPAATPVLKSMAPVKKQQLIDSMLHLDARQWINGQNDREFTRRKQDEKREVFFYNGRAGKLNTLQMEAFNKMHPLGWQAMAVACRASTNEHALVCRGSANGIFGVIYPDGSLERNMGRVEFKVSIWDRRTLEVESEADADEVAKAVEAASTGDTSKIIPIMAEQVPSSVAMQHPMWQGV